MLICTISSHSTCLFLEPSMHMPGTSLLKSTTNKFNCAWDALTKKQNNVSWQPRTSSSLSWPHMRTGPSVFGRYTDQSQRLVCYCVSPVSLWILVPKWAPLNLWQIWHCQLLWTKNSALLSIGHPCLCLLSRQSTLATSLWHCFVPSPLCKHDFLLLLSAFHVYSVVIAPGHRWAKLIAFILYSRIYVPKLDHNEPRNFRRIFDEIPILAHLGDKMSWCGPRWPKIYSPILTAHLGNFSEFLRFICPRWAATDQAQPRQGFHWGINSCQSIHDQY